MYNLQNPCKRYERFFDCCLNSIFFKHLLLYKILYSILFVNKDFIELYLHWCHDYCVNIVLQVIYVNLLKTVMSDCWTNNGWKLWLDAKRGVRMKLILYNTFTSLNEPEESACWNIIRKGGYADNQHFPCEKRGYDGYQHFLCGKRGYAGYQHFPCGKRGYAC